MTLAIVAGAVANKPHNGGASWTRLSWALGLRRLGFDVHFVEQLSPAIDRAAVVYFDRVMSAAALDHTSTLLSPEGATVRGLELADLCDLAAEAALLVNISGHLTIPELRDRAEVRVFIDLDPGYTQIWEALGMAGEELDGHDFWFTVGENVGRPECLIPTNGRPWRPIRQPVVLADWPVDATPLDTSRFTTVASWRGPYGPVEYAGRTFGVKAHEFRRFLPVPHLVPAAFEMALDIHPGDGKDRSALEEHGWRLVDPHTVAGDPASFRDYVRGSTAEFSVAQGVYVQTSSGWFSDRSVRYLASGRPVLVQDTGFSRLYPVGEGIVTFTDLEEAVAGAQSIISEYERHCRAARALAGEWFGAEGVLGRLCEEVDVAP